MNRSIFPMRARWKTGLFRALSDQPDLRHVVLQCTAVNYIDASALESLEAVNTRLKDGGVTFHLSEVKGPVMDQLARGHFLHDLTGEVFLTQFDAMAKLSPDLTRSCAAEQRCDTLLRSA